MACRFTLTQRVLPQGVKFPYYATQWVFATVPWQIFCKCGNTSPVHCQILKGAKVQLFQGRKQNLYSFLFTLPKVAPCTLVISLSIFRRKITEMDRAVVIPSEVVRLEPNPPQFLKFGHVPPPLQTMIEK